MFDIFMYKKRTCYTIIYCLVKALTYVTAFFPTMKYFRNDISLLQTVLQRTIPPAAIFSGCRGRLFQLFSSYKYHPSEHPRCDGSIHSYDGFLMLLVAANTQTASEFCSLLSVFPWHRSPVCSAAELANFLFVLSIQHLTTVTVWRFGRWKCVSLF